jgi:GTPase
LATVEDGTQPPSGSKNSGARSKGSLLRSDESATSSRWNGRQERAVLVGVDLAVRPRTTRSSLAGARNVAVCPNSSGEDAELRPNADRADARPAVPGLDAEESLAEFRELVASAGAKVTAELLQRRPRPDPATLVGAGKVEEIAGVAASTEADLVLFDHDLTPTQLRNLEAALPCRVLDRTQLILDIFARHARTREGQLQVELAQLEYMLPRLTGRGKSMSRTGRNTTRNRPQAHSATHRSVEG